jgi:uridylate kinase
MIAVAKWSGEALNKGAANDQPWTEEGRKDTVAKLAALSEQVRSGEHAARGVAVVVGAGNLAMRGEQIQARGFSPKHADMLGMLGTYWNADKMSEWLTEAKVPHRLLVAEGIQMPGMGDVVRCTPAAMRAAFDDGELVVIGGGSGKPGQSTDAAGMDHGEAYCAATGEDVCVSKATRLGGVFDSNPELWTPGNPEPRMFSAVSAATMAENEWLAVDPVCLDRIQATGLNMRLHGFEAPLSDVIAGTTGTLVVAQPGVLEYATA